MKNPFVKLIEEGRITKLAELRSAYRKIVMRTHPDAIGSDEQVEKFLSYSNYYEEAKLYLSQNEANTKHDYINYRLLFYQQLYNIEFLEEPYSYKPKNFKKLIDDGKQKAKKAFDSWNHDQINIYIKANEEYDRIKIRYMIEPYLKDAFKRNLLPVFHNLISFHLTGQQFYKRQINQNIKALLYRLKQEGFENLSRYIELLMDDSKKGPAIFMDAKIM